MLPGPLTLRPAFEPLEEAGVGLLLQVDEDDQPRLDRAIWVVWLPGAASLVTGRSERMKRVDSRSPSVQLLRYLTALESEFRLGTESTVGSITERFRNAVRTESGRPVEGISLVLSGADRELFGVDEISLGGRSDLEGLIGTLAQLRVELGESRDAGI